MCFNPDPIKQNQEIIFNRKIKKNIHRPLVFKNTIVSQTNSQKHLGVILDFKLTLWTQDVNWTYTRRSEDVLDFFWTSYVRSIYVLCLRETF